MQLPVLSGWDVTQLTVFASINVSAAQIFLAYMKQFHVLFREIQICGLATPTGIVEETSYFLSQNILNDA